MQNTQAGKLIEELKACETSVWQALQKGDAKADAAALCDEFLGVYGDGFAGKADHVGQLADGPSIEHFALSGFRTLMLGQEHALLSYRAEFRRTAATRSEAMYVSSIWQRTGTGWINVFSQDTPEAVP